jgi:hypothetical protein
MIKHRIMNLLTDYQISIADAIFYKTIETAH